MNRYIRYGALIGAVMMGAGCQESAPPAEAPFVPRPTFATQEETQALLITRASGVAWDPEAFFFHLAQCDIAFGGRGQCPIPPFLSEGVPHYLRSMIRGANISTFDAEVPGPIGTAVTTDNLGIWLLPTVPFRYGTPYFSLNTGEGSVPPASEPLGPPLPLAPVSTYLPTLSGRPIFTGLSGTCTGLDNPHTARNGILEAVARHLTAQGTATTVDDLVNPARYWGAHVFWIYIAGNPVLRVPASGVALEASAGQIIALDWAPPGTLPAPPNQSTRGFFVTNGSISPMGVYMVLFPNNGPPPANIQFRYKDTVTDPVSRRPWFFPNEPGSIGPGIVIYHTNQMLYGAVPNHPSPPPPPFLCLPP
jgi:hypothetical protein